MNFLLLIISRLSAGETETYGVKPYANSYRRRSGVTDKISNLYLANTSLRFSRGKRNRFH